MAKRISSGTPYPGTLTLEVLEGAYRYNAWIAEAILPYIKSPVLEVGAGIGNISTFFLDKQKVVLTDKDQILLNYLKKKFAKKKPLIFSYDITKPPKKSMIDQFSSVVAVNVLEHINNDQAALLNLKETLNKNGKLILLVPAKKTAYNKLDKELGHYRRYEKDELISKLKRAGYAIDSIKFFNTVGLVTWVVRNYLTRQDIQLTSRQVATFDLIVPLLKRVEKVVSVPFGISLIAVARNEK